jgi:hypothetical protein
LTSTRRTSICRTSASGASQFQRPNNPLFVPESSGDAGGAANAFYGIGQYAGIGYSPFGVNHVENWGENRSGSETPAAIENVPLARAYGLLSQMSPLILDAAGLPRRARYYQFQSRLEIRLLATRPLGADQPAFDDSAVGQRQPAPHLERDGQLPRVHQPRRRRPEREDAGHRLVSQALSSCPPAPTARRFFSSSTA